MDEEEEGGEGSVPISSWLASLHLQQYTESFQRCQLCQVGDCQALGEEELSQLGVALPGHRRRILMALQKAFPEPPGTPQGPSSRPVPRKRHIFRPAASARQCQPGTQGQLDQQVCQLDQQCQPCQPCQLDQLDQQLDQQGQLCQQSHLGQLCQLDQQSQLCQPCQLDQLGQQSQLCQPCQPCQLDQPGQLDPLSQPCQAEQPELPSPPQPGTSCQLAQEGAPTPPPIPPRLGTRPPLKFYPMPTVGTTQPPAMPIRCPPGPEVSPPHSPGSARLPLPPLPAKRHQVEGQSQCQEAALAPKCPPLVPPRTVPRRSSVGTAEVPSPGTGPSVPPCPPALLPNTRAPKVPPRTSLPFLPEFDDSDYEDSAWEDEVGGPRGEMVDKEETEPPGAAPWCPPGSSLCGEDELSEDHPEAACSSAGSSRGQAQPCPHPPMASSGHSLPGHGSSSPAGTIKAGWLDKSPPQGSYIYQRRWVRLEPEHLRYFESQKDAYSKRLVPVSCILHVGTVGEQKFEVVTTNRSFIFRAESDADRNEWVRALQQAVEERKGKALQRAPMGTDASQEVGKSGILELRGFKHKVFVVVAGDKVFLYKNAEDHQVGIGITYIEMKVGSVKEVERQGFDLATPHRTFSFLAESEPEREQWVEALQEAISEALSSSEVAQRIWQVDANRSCADCGAPSPAWASINLCVVICSRCAGEHRGLGPGISKVRSLKLDRKVWTEELVQLFQQLGNAVANQFWAANLPASEAITPSSASWQRRRFLVAKYQEGKYRRCHPLSGHQEELDRALCVAVTTSDLAETQALLFCGASASCASGDPLCPTPLALAERSGQRLQMEFLLQNKTSETPRLEVGISQEKAYLVPLPSVTHNGFLYKTPSMAKPLGERKSTEEFSRRWCRLREGVLSYYESERSAAPSGQLRAQDIVCLARDPPHTHGLEGTFEVYTEAERLYLFGSESSDSAREWLLCIAKAVLPPLAEELLAEDFQRLGRLRYKGGLDLEQLREGWFALAGCQLHLCPQHGHRQEPIQLRKLQELSIQGDNEVLVLVERRRTLYLQGGRRLDFQGWVQAIQKAAAGTGASLAEQQLTDANVPLLVERCIEYITQCGLTSEGIYRKSGQTSRSCGLLQLLRRDARGLRLRQGEQQVDDVASTLKRFFRELAQGIFTQRWGQHWLQASDLEDEEEKLKEYRRLLDALPTVNRATLKALINHLFRVQLFSSENQMNTHNLAIVFGPTLFQTDGKDLKAGRVVEDLISHYVEIFNVEEQEMKKQQDEILAIMKLREAASSGTQQAGDFICTVYLEEKTPEAEQHIKIPAAMTAEELTLEILERRKILVKEKDYWSCFEVNEREEAGGDLARAGGGLEVDGGRVRRCWGGQ
ncbi:arf-GAP with Rho-GAP domain, ANK repeat and PH domain-containing protein 1 [Pogoniulus pusillus]|uniref:arf-GAP with Rho-GAP domain, ANK repeat and PH domain-containing protein 1 n=1 Tax=Pogoniulus pusillus TaxID=488313 RepID=UPI0030B9A90D